jgi:hypothetical protein
MKYFNKNQNHRALCYYAMNNHMYLVKDKKLVKSLVESGKNPEHKFKSSLLENDEVINHFFEKTIYLNLSLDEIIKTMKDNKNCIFMFSRCIHNINDMFIEFITKLNVVPSIKRCNKSNLMEFHFTCGEDNTYIFCCDPNDINIINYNTVKLLCEKHKIDWNNQTYISFITQLKNKFFDEINGRIKFSK